MADEDVARKDLASDMGVSRTYEGNYSKYVLAKAAWVEAQNAAWEKQQKQIEHTKDIISRLGAGANAGHASSAEKLFFYGEQVAVDELRFLYGDSRANGFGPEVKMRILMGTYALSAGYYDAYYKRAQQVRTLVQKSFKAALDENDILISPAAPSAAYKIGEKTNDPLAMYAGDIMTVNVNLAGLPALVLPCGLIEGGPAGLPVGLQMIGAAFDEAKLLRVGHIFEQTLQVYRFIPPLLGDDRS